MARGETCGNEYEKAFQVMMHGSAKTARAALRGSNGRTSSRDLMDKSIEVPIGGLASGLELVVVNARTRSGSFALRWCGEFDGETIAKLM
jgi:hypothetical protein